MSWLKSDYCTECDGEGFVRMKTFDTGEYAEFENFQCEECERLESIKPKEAV